MRQAMSCSSRQAGVGDRSSPRQFSSPPRLVPRNSPCGKRPPRPVVTTTRLRAHRAIKWDRANRPRRILRSPLPLAGPISNGDARRRKLREEGRNETGLSTAIDRTARNEGSTRGSATGRSTATAEYRKRRNSPMRRRCSGRWQCATLEPAMSIPRAVLLIQRRP